MKTVVAILLLAVSTVASASYEDMVAVLAFLNENNMGYVYSQKREVLLVVTKTESDAAVVEQVRTQMPANVELRVWPVNQK